MTTRGHFLYNPLSKSLKYDLWLIGAISFTIPYLNHWSMTRLQEAISFTILYKHHRNMTCDCQGPFPLQLLIKIIAIWPMSAGGNFLYLPYENHWNMTYGCEGRYFLYKSLSKYLKCDIWLIGAISFTSPYQNHWHMTYDW
jgi:hypothetical protein